MDLSMPGTDGLTATQQVVSLFTATRVLVLTTSADPSRFVARWMPDRRPSSTRTATRPRCWPASATSLGRPARPSGPDQPSTPSPVATGYRCRLLGARPRVHADGEHDPHR